eukprot:jgi/Mesvir1/28494/Mv25585-RA.1
MGALMTSQGRAVELMQERGSSDGWYIQPPLIPGSRHHVQEPVLELAGESVHLLRVHCNGCLRLGFGHREPTDDALQVGRYLKALRVAFRYGQLFQVVQLLANGGVAWLRGCDSPSHGSRERIDVCNEAEVSVDKKGLAKWCEAKAAYWWDRMTGRDPVMKPLPPPSGWARPRARRGAKGPKRQGWYGPHGRGTVRSRIRPTRHTAGHDPWWAHKRCAAHPSPHRTGSLRGGKARPGQLCPHPSHIDCERGRTGTDTPSLTMMILDHAPIGTAHAPIGTGAQTIVQWHMLLSEPTTLA